MKREEKISLVEFMNKKGIFLIKKMVKKVAEKMKISKIAVCSYLDKIRIIDIKIYIIYIYRLYIIIIMRYTIKNLLDNFSNKTIKCI